MKELNYLMISVVIATQLLLGCSNVSNPGGDRVNPPLPTAKTGSLTIKGTLFVNNQPTATKILNNHLSSAELNQVFQEVAAATDGVQISLVGASTYRGAAVIQLDGRFTLTIADITPGSYLLNASTTSSTTHISGWIKTGISVTIEADKSTPVTLKLERNTVYPLKGSLLNLPGSYTEAANGNWTTASVKIIDLDGTAYTARGYNESGAKFECLTAPIDVIIASVEVTNDANEIYPIDVDTTATEYVEGYSIFDALDGKDLSSNYTAIGTGSLDVTIEPINPVEGSTDTTPPVITLLGDDPLYLNNGEAFHDQGATATDDTDGNIPVILETIAVSPELSSFDPTTPTRPSGTSGYAKYKAVDAAGNMTEKYRIVFVVVTGSNRNQQFVFTNTAPGKIHLRFQLGYGPVHVPLDECLLGLSPVQFCHSWSELDSLGAIFMIDGQPSITIEQPLNKSAAIDLENPLFVSGFVSRVYTYAKIAGVTYWFDQGVVRGFNGPVMMTRSDGDNYDLAL